MPMFAWPPVAAEYFHVSKIDSVAFVECVVVAAVVAVVAWVHLHIDRFDTYDKDLLIAVAAADDDAAANK